METYHVELTLSEIETIERALLKLRDTIKKYVPEIRNEEQKNINNTLEKLRKA